MILDVYVIGVSLCHYAFRSFQKPGDLTLGQEIKVTAEKTHASNLPFFFKCG